MPFSEPKKRDLSRVKRVRNALLVTKRVRKVTLLVTKRALISPFYLYLKGCFQLFYFFSASFTLVKPLVFLYWVLLIYSGPVHHNFDYFKKLVQSSLHSFLSASNALRASHSPTSSPCVNSHPFKQT